MVARYPMRFCVVRCLLTLLRTMRCVHSRKRETHLTCARVTVFFVAMATLRMQKTILVARRFRQRVAQDHESATILQRAWRVTKQRRAQLKVSVFTLRKIRFQVGSLPVGNCCHTGKTDRTKMS